MISVYLVATLMLADPTSAGDASSAPTDFIHRADDLWSRREDAAAAKELTQLLKEEVAAHPTSLEALVRRAMQQCWVADGMGDGTSLKAQMGKACWDTAEKAVAVAPNDVRAQYWATVGIGLYSEGVGILTALSEGLEGKFLARGEAAMRLDPTYLLGSPQMLLGRFYFKLPWPKRDLEKSEAMLQATVKAYPTNLLAKLFFADTLWSRDKQDLARKQIDELLASKATDAQDRRSQEFAKRWLKAR